MNPVQLVNRAIIELIRDGEDLSALCGILMYPFMIIYSMFLSKSITGKWWGKLPRS